MDAKENLLKRLLFFTAAGLSLLAVLAFIMPSEAFGRAGGGGGYSGGRGGGYSGGGGNGGGGEAMIVYFLIRLVFEYPLIGIPLTCVVLYFFYLTKVKGTDAYQGHVIRQGRTVQGANQQADALGKIQARDAAFDQPAFLDRVRHAFVTLQTAWCEQKLSAVRPFISDGIHERFSLQLDEQKSLGYRDHMENLDITQAQIVQVESDELFDVLTVQIRAKASDYRVSLKDGKRLSGAKGVEAFVEYWSFLRRSGVTTEADKTGLMEGNCPNCAAPIEMNAAAKCTHCDALIRSGSYDWVLAEITQASEWEAATATTISGVQAFKDAGDSEFNIQHIEDRASVMYWRKMLADQRGKVDPLRKIASAEYCETWRQREKKNRSNAASGSRSYYGECAVGAVATLGVIPGATDTDEPDRALVEIRWSGTRFTTDANGKATRTKKTTVSRSLYILGRKSGVKSSAENAVTSAHCPQCGAPEAGGSSNACAYCGAVLNAGSHDWILLGTPGWAAEEAQATLRALRGKAAGMVAATTGAADMVGGKTPGGGALVTWLIHMMLADGEIDAREEEMLRRVAANHGISPAQVDVLLIAGRAGELDTPTPSGLEEARSWLLAMARMALADGKIDPTERAILISVGQRLNFSPYDIKQFIKQAKATLFQAAKGDLKQAKIRKRNFSA